MVIADLTQELKAPLKWLQPSRVNRHAMALVTVSNLEGEKSVLLSHKGVMVVDAKNYVLAPKERITPKSTPIRDGIAIAGKAAAWLFVAFLFSFTLLNISGVVKSQIVLTASMSPTINPGDMVISTAPSRVKLRLVMWWFTQVRGLMAQMLPHLPTELLQGMKNQDLLLKVITTQIQMSNSPP